MQVPKVITQILNGWRTPSVGRSRFGQLQAQYLDRLSRWPLHSFPGERIGGRVAVLVTPWLTTPVPFYSLECARMLASRGWEVTLLWDASNVFVNAAKASEVAAVEAVVKKFAPFMRVVDVADSAVADGVELAWVDSLVYENAIRNRKGEGAALDFLAAHPECAVNMKAHAGRIHTLLQREKFDWMLIPGGVWASSGLYAQIAADIGLSFTAYDSGEGILFVAQDGPAAHFSDVERAFRTVVPAATAAERERMMAKAREKLDIRRGGRDMFRLQPVTSEAERKEEPYHLVVPLNLRSDTAALFRQRLFRSVTHWLTELLGWLTTQPHVRVAIRQHPCERIPQYRGSDSWGDLLAPFASLGNRARFVSAEDPINTYDLIDNCSAVLPFTSRVGIEGAMLGKPVILGTRCYYQDCGFVRNPATIAEYFQDIEAAIGGGLRPDAAARDTAALVYYIAEECVPQDTNFTPQPPDFEKWVEIAPDEIWKTPTGADFAEAMTTRQPVSCVQYRRLRDL